MLEASRLELNAAVDGLSDSQVAIKPAADRWSILECVEHIAIVEERLLGRLENAERVPPSVDRQKEADLAARLVQRVNRVEAPVAVRPAGRFTSLVEAVACFHANRVKTIQFAEDHGADLYERSVEHPRFGTVNGTELMVIIAAHGRRHTEQIREVRAVIEKAGINTLP